MTPKNAIQKSLYKLTFNKYFESIPLQAIFDIIKDNGGIVVDESGMPWSGFLCGESGRTSFAISGIKACLILSWYKMQSGRYEITAYVS